MEEYWVLTFPEKLSLVELVWTTASDTTILRQKGNRFTNGKPLLNLSIFKIDLSIFKKSVIYI